MSLHDQKSHRNGFAGWMASVSPPTLSHGCHPAALLAVVAVLVAPAVAVGHPGHLGSDAGLMGGLLHPLTGLDHLLAMLGVGLWSHQNAGRARWSLPAGFVAAVLAGAGLAGLGVALPLVEVGIALSVVAVGGLVAAQQTFGSRAVAGLGAIFAVFHGYAHVAELSAGASAGGYVAGFMATTAAGIMVGAGLASMLERVGADRVVRGLGVVIGAAGAVFMYAAIAG